MRLAILADIHGNLPALNAVLTELERLQPDHVILDGDLINAVPFSSEVIDEVRKRDWTVVRGNHEFYYLDFNSPRALPGMEDPKRWGQLHWLMNRISDEQGDYLAMLPDERTLYYRDTEPVLVAHGVPGRNRVGFYNEQREQSIVSEIEDVRQSTFLSAHTHVQVDRHVHAQVSADMDLLSHPHEGDGEERNGRTHHWHVINPGSVGLPLNGDPRAQFAMVESVPDSVSAGGWQATHYRIDYDRRPALKAYTTTGMLAVGGVVTQLFYWELVTAEAEIVLFMGWARKNGWDTNLNMSDAFDAYCKETGRDQLVRNLDPLKNRQLASNSSSTR